MDTKQLEREYRDLTAEYRLNSEYWVFAQSRGDTHAMNESMRKQIKIANRMAEIEKVMYGH